MDYRKDPNQAQPARKGVVFGGILLVLIVVIFALKFRGNAPLLPSPTPTVAVSQDSAHAAPKPLAATTPLPQFTPTPQSVAVTPRPAPLTPDKLTPEQLVAELTMIGAGGPITPEQAARFKADLNELIQRGPQSVGAIQAFLAKSTDTAYGNVTGGDQLGFSSLRTSLIDALRQIGGPEAQAAMVATLQTTAAPSELLQLANALNQQAPGQYRDQILAAAQETLKMAANNQLGTNTELGPLLRMVQNYGAPSSMSDGKNDPTQLASAVQLASLPDGQGLSALSKMAQESGSGSQLMATEMIAQMAGDNSDALNTLAQLAEDGKISSGDWTRLAPILGGEQYQLDPSSQKYNLVGTDLTQDQISQRILLLDTFMTYVPDGSGAYKALTQERNLLTTKSSGN